MGNSTFSQLWLLTRSVLLQSSIKPIIHCRFAIFSIFMQLYTNVMHRVVRRKMPQLVQLLRTVLVVPWSTQCKVLESVPRIVTASNTERSKLSRNYPKGKPTQPMGWMLMSSNLVTGYGLLFGCFRSIVTTVHGQPAAKVSSSVILYNFELIFCSVDVCLFPFHCGIFHLSCSKIMEARGNSPSYPAQGSNFVRSSLNYGPFPSIMASIFGWQSQKRSSYDQAFHTYTLEWTPSWMRASVDSKLQTTLDLVVQGKGGKNFWYVSLSNLCLFPHHWHLLGIAGTFRKRPRMAAHRLSSMTFIRLLLRRSIKVSTKHVRSLPIYWLYSDKISIWSWTWLRAGPAVGSRMA
jgi:hypothetical protein